MSSEPSSTSSSSPPPAKPAATESTTTTTKTTSTKSSSSGPPSKGSARRGEDGVVEDIEGAHALIELTRHDGPEGGDADVAKAAADDAKSTSPVKKRPSTEVEEATSEKRIKVEEASKNETSSETEQVETKATPEIKAVTPLVTMDQSTTAPVPLTPIVSTITTATTAPVAPSVPLDTTPMHTTTPAAATMPTTEKAKDDNTTDEAVGGDGAAEIVTGYTDNDVLLGRGGHAVHHVGNIRFRQVVLSLLKEYVVANKTTKTKIAASVVKSIQEKGGRFLRMEDRSSSRWSVVPYLRSRIIVSQRFREEGTKRSHIKFAALAQAGKLPETTSTPATTEEAAGVGLPMEASMGVDSTTSMAVDAGAATAVPATIPVENAPVPAAATVIPPPATATATVATTSPAPATTTMTTTTTTAEASVASTTVEHPCADVGMEEATKAAV